MGFIFHKNFSRAIANTLVVSHIKPIPAGVLGPPVILSYITLAYLGEAKWVVVNSR
jgi:hypothetical protein